MNEINFDYLEEAPNTNTPSRWQWPLLTSNSQSISSQSSLSPPVPKQMNSTSLPTSPIGPSSTNSPVYVPPHTSLHKSVSVR
jgi:hypothetical protein